ncbi:MAG: amidase [Actinobacteria bacterium]|nr:amidase [Actinomycetota bacterium]
MSSYWPPLVELAHQVRTRVVSSRELVLEAVARVERVEPQLHAWVVFDPDRALAEADAVDRRVARGEDPGALAGIPLGVKDMEDAAGYVTTYGSLIHRDDPPAVADSVMVARLRAAGCVVLGKLNTPEYGFSADTTSPMMGSTHNPWQPGRSPGGSSGASAAMRPSGAIPLATAGDSGGSIRIPAALCGLPGFKPSNGRTAVGGPTPPGNGWLGVRSIMAADVADHVHALGSLVGHEPTDLHSIPTHDWPGTVSPRLPDRVVWSPAPGWPVDAEIEAVCAVAVERLAAAGVDIIEVPALVDGIPLFDYYTVATVYQRRLHGHRRGTPEWEMLDPGIRSQIDHAEQRVSAVDFVTALDAAHRHNLDIERHFATAPIILCPTVAGVTARCGEPGVVNGEPTMFWAPFTQLFNLTKHPAGSVNCGFTADGMPVGLHVVASQQHDLTVLSTMAAFEDLFAHDRRPQVLATP